MTTQTRKKGGLAGSHASADSVKRNKRGAQKHPKVSTSIILNLQQQIHQILRRIPEQGCGRSDLGAEHHHLAARIVRGGSEGWVIPHASGAPGVALIGISKRAQKGGEEKFTNLLNPKKTDTSRHYLPTPALLSHNPACGLWGLRRSRWPPPRPTGWGHNVCA